MEKFSNFWRSIRQMSKRKLGLIASVFLVVVAAVSVVSLNAAAEEGNSLPDGSFYNYVKGIYFEGTNYDHADIILPDEAVYITDEAEFGEAVAFRSNSILHGVQAYITVNGERVATVNVPDSVDFDNLGEMDTSADFFNAINERYDGSYGGVTGDVGTAYEGNTYASFEAFRNSIVPSSGEETPSEGEENPGEENPSEENPSEENPSEENPSEENPSEENPSEENPSEENPSEENPSEENPSEENPSEENPSEENPGEDDPGEDDPGTGELEIRLVIYSQGSFAETTDTKALSIAKAYSSSSVTYFRVKEADRVVATIDTKTYVDPYYEYEHIIFRIDESGNGLPFPITEVVNGSGDKYYYTPKIRLYRDDDDCYGNIYSTYFDEDTFEGYAFNKNSTILYYDYSGNLNILSTGSLAGLTEIESSSGGYGYSSKLPVRMEVEYEVQDDVTDENDPPLNDREPLTASAKCVYGGYEGTAGNVKISGADKLTKDSSVFDSWTVGGVNTIDDGEIFYVTYYDEESYTISITPGYEYRGIDADTGEVVLHYNAVPEWRDYTLLKYELNCPNGMSMLWDNSGNSYGSSDFNTIPPADDTHYAIGATANVTSATYRDYDTDPDASVYEFLGWVTDNRIGLVVPTGSTGVYKTSDGSLVNSSIALHAGAEITMDTDHTLYGLWAAKDADEFVTVEFIIRNGTFYDTAPYNISNFATALPGTAPGGWEYYYEMYSSTVLPAPAEGGTIFVKCSDSGYELETYAVSKPNSGYGSYIVSRKEYGEDDENPISQASKGTLINPNRMDYYNAVAGYVGIPTKGSTVKKIVYEIDYLDIGECQIWLYADIDAYNDIEDNYGSRNGRMYMAINRDRGEDIPLSNFFTVEGDDHIVKLNDVYGRDDETGFPYEVVDPKFENDDASFIGWAVPERDYNAWEYIYDKNSLIESVNFPADGYDTEVRLVAVWDISYKVTYDGNGATSADDTIPKDATRYEPNATVTVKGNPNNALYKDYYKFIGWAYADDATEPDFKVNSEGAVEGTDTTFVITENTTLYAVWEAKQFSLGYAAGAEDGTIEGIPDVVENITLDEVKDGNYPLDDGKPTRKGYTFNKWQMNDGTLLNPGGAIPFAAFDNTNMRAIATATWNINNYHVRYYDINGNEITEKAVEVPYKGDFKCRPNTDIPSIPGKNATGWTIMDSGKTSDANGQGIVGSTDTTYSMPDGDVKFQATYETIHYTVTYTAGEGTGSYVDDNLTYGDEYTVKDISDTGISYEGHNFKGWSLVSPEGGSYPTGIGGKFNLVENVEYEATWSPIIYTVTLSYAANGGEPDNKLPAVESADAPLTTTVKAPLEGFGKTGFKFAGWNTAADGTGDPYKKGDTITITADTTLFAQWTNDSFYVEYYDEEGKDKIGSKLYTYMDTVTVGAGVDASKIPTLEGKTFKEWVIMDNAQTDGSGNVIGKNDGYPMPGETVKYKASYSINTYTVRYVVTGGPADYAAPEDKEYEYGKTAIVEPKPTNDRYTFNGWTYNGETYNGGESLVVKSDIILVGEWSHNGWGITYRSGYTGDVANAPHNSLLNEYPDHANYGSDYTIQKNETFTRYQWPGKKFVGWKVVGISTTGIDFIDNFIAKYVNSVPVGTVICGGEVIENITSDFNLEAVWEDEEYRVTYDGNGATEGTAPDDSNVYHYQDTVTVMYGSTLAKTGYRMDHWNTKNDDTGISYQPGEQFNITSDVELFAIWVRETIFYVRYDGNGATSGDVPAPVEYFVDDTVTVESEGDLARNNCQFKEWNTQKNGKGTGYQSGETFDMPNHEVVLYAIWDYEKGNPGTGESVVGICIAVISMVAAAAAGAFVFLRRKRKTA